MDNNFNAFVNEFNRLGCINISTDNIGKGNILCASARNGANYMNITKKRGCEGFGVYHVDNATRIQLLGLTFEEVMLIVQDFGSHQQPTHCVIGDVDMFGTDEDLLLTFEDEDEVVEELVKTADNIVEILETLKVLWVQFPSKTLYRVAVENLGIEVASMLVRELELDFGFGL